MAIIKKTVTQKETRNTEVGDATSVQTSSVKKNVKIFFFGLCIYSLTLNHN